MSDFRPSTKEEFVEAFLAYQPAGEEESLREILRRETKTKYQLAEELKLFRKHCAPATPVDVASKEEEKGAVDLAASNLSVSTTSSDASEIYSPFEDGSEQFKMDFIQEVQNQAGLNLIRKHPLYILTAAAIVAVSAFTIPLIVFVIFEAITGTTAMAAILPFLPFLAALTPVGAALAFAGLIAAASMIIFALTVGIIAGASHRNVKIDEGYASPSVTSSTRETALKHRPSAAANQDALDLDEKPGPSPLEGTATATHLGKLGGAQHVAPVGLPVTVATVVGNPTVIRPTTPASATPDACML